MRGHARMHTHTHTHKILCFTEIPSLFSSEVSSWWCRRGWRVVSQFMFMYLTETDWKHTHTHTHTHTHIHTHIGRAKKTCSHIALIASFHISSMVSDRPIKLKYLFVGLFSSFRAGIEMGFDCLNAIVGHHLWHKVVLCFYCRLLTHKSLLYLKYWVCVTSKGWHYCFTASHAHNYNTIDSTNGFAQCTVWCVIAFPTLPWTMMLLCRCCQASHLTIYFSGLQVYGTVDATAAIKNEI